jgi:hypothetical protein
MEMEQMTKRLLAEMKDEIKEDIKPIDKKGSLKEKPTVKIERK